MKIVIILIKPVSNLILLNVKKGHIKVGKGNKLFYPKQLLRDLQDSCHFTGELVS